MKKQQIEMVTDVKGPPYGLWIQGKWHAVTLILDDEIIMDADECTYQFHGDSVTCLSRKRARGSTWESSHSSYRLDTKKKPKEICFFDFPDRSHPPRASAYDLQKDQLLLCDFSRYAEGVPREIKRGDGLRLITLVRARK